MEKYALQYTFNIFDNNGNGYTIQEATKINEDDKDFGFTDAFMCSSIIRPEEGGLSIEFFSRDGQNDNQELSSREYFKVWCSLCNFIIETEDGTCFDWQTKILKDCLEIVREKVIARHGLGGLNAP